MRQEAARYPGQEQQVMEFFRKNPQAAENLRAPIFEEKVVDFMLELAKVTDRTRDAGGTVRPPAAAPDSGSSGTGRGAADHPRHSAGTSGAARACTTLTARGLGWRVGDAARQPGPGARPRRRPGVRRMT